MPELQFNVEAAEVAPASEVAPAASAALLLLRLAIHTVRADEQVQSIALTVQLHIEPARRRYSENEKLALFDLFGEPPRWSTTVRPLFWTTVNANVPAFIGETRFALAVPCDLDSGLAAAKYLRALQSGEVPVTLLFSGRVISLCDAGVQMTPIPWSQEAAFRIPVALCRQIMDAPSAAASLRGATWM